VAEQSKMKAAAILGACGFDISGQLVSHRPQFVVGSPFSARSGEGGYPGAGLTSLAELVGEYSGRLSLQAESTWFPKLTEDDPNTR